MSEESEDQEYEVAENIDKLIAEHDYPAAKHVVGGRCSYRLARGEPLSDLRCAMCERLSKLLDLESVKSRWTERISGGSLIGRYVELVELGTARSLRDAENAWLLYRECEAVQRDEGAYLLRRYFVSFTCSGKHFVLRESPPPIPGAQDDQDEDRSPAKIPPIEIMVAQLLELFDTQNSCLPKGFVHSNPTMESLHFPHSAITALKRRGAPSYDIGPYVSKHLLSVDYGGVESGFLTYHSTKAPAVVLGGAEALGSITGNPGKETFAIRKDASVDSFIRDYKARYSWRLALIMLLRGLAFLYTPERGLVSKRRSIAMQCLVDKGLIPHGPSSARNLIEAFSELRGRELPMKLRVTGADLSLPTISKK